VLIILWYFKSWVPPIYDASTVEGNDGITVIVVARNEAEHIASCLHSIAANHCDQRPIQLILVDDHSEDLTVSIATSLNISFLKILRLGDYPNLHSYGNSFKKAAISYALEHARHPLIMTTDADCIVGNQWIESFCHILKTDDVRMLTGPIVLKGNNSPLCLFQQMDMMGTMAGTNAGLRSKHYYSANAANMMFYKLDYIDFLHHENHLRASGDDMFFIQHLASKNKSVGFAFHQNAIVTTVYESTWKDLFHQRLRWATKTKDYKSITMKALMTFFFIFHSFLLVIFLMGFLMGSKYSLAVFLFMLGLKICVDFILLRRTKSFFQLELKPYRFIPLVLMHTLYIAGIGVLGIFMNSYIWKGRKVH
jgi:cellulose synthase/poly-beta-1,6-N-acetylglucosamine synthase-like glycosyltransferase